MSEPPPVCILTAGKGTRMETYGKQLNKALVPLDHRAIISHIVAHFPEKTEFVVALGYLGQQVRDYLRIAHPDRSFTFVEVDKFEGEGSGPGYSLWCCREYLRRPFYSVSCDTLWDNPLPEPDAANWMGVAPVPASETPRYLNFKVEDGRITDWRDKEFVADPCYQPFVGLCYIADHQLFWDALVKPDIGRRERQVTAGLAELIRERNVRALPIQWTDVGTSEQYRAAVLKVADREIRKPDSISYAVGSKIIEYLADTTVYDRRVTKAGLNTAVFPRITDRAVGFFAYDNPPGETLSRDNNPDIFRNLLRWLDTELWRPVVANSDQMRAACLAVYRDETLTRLAAYDRKYDPGTHPVEINGQALAPLDELLSRMPWAQLEDGVPRFIHGELQFDNVLYDRNSARFTLLDWRADFGGHIEFGDLYFDLANLRGGIILNHDSITKNRLTYEERGGSAFFDFAQPFQSAAYLQILDEFVRERSLDVLRVHLLVGIVYLNMAALHHYPFDKILRALGHQVLATELERHA